MSDKAKMIYLHALTPIHSGTGQGTGVIDLPIAREKATGWPFLPSTGLKGVWRAALEEKHNPPGKKDWGTKVFGDQNRAGAFCFADQRILCLPIRSFFGTFAYVTCPLALQRFKRDRDSFQLGVSFPDAPVATGEQILICTTSVLDKNGTVYLEDLDLIKAESNADAIAKLLSVFIFPVAERNAFVSRFAIVSDEIFNFLSETGTEISAHIKIDEDTKTTTPGSLRYEESVPTEAIFYGPVLLSEFAREVDLDRNLDNLKTTILQIGGKSTSGQGLCRVIVEPRVEVQP